VLLNIFHQYLNLGEFLKKSRSMIVKWLTEKSGRLFSWRKHQ
jgi:hypothetical protein